MIRRIGLLLALVAVLGIASCARIFNLNSEPTAIWTPVPVENTGTGVATVEPTATETETMPPTATPRPAFTPRAPSARADSASATATQDPKLVVITEADVLRAVESSVGSENGASAKDLRIRFMDERMHIEAAQLQYGPVNVENLVLIGRLVAEDGKLKLETESVSPRGLLTALIPTVANQALEQYTSKWYVEEVRTLDGQIEVRIR